MNEQVASPFKAAYHPFWSVSHVGIRALVFLSIAGLIVGIAVWRFSAALHAQLPRIDMRDALTPEEARSQARDRMAFFEARLARNPTDIDVLNSLSRLYLQRLRETGAFSDLDLALRTSHRSLSVVPLVHNVAGLTSRAMAEFASHEFSAARKDAIMLTRLDGTGTPYALLGDAEAELGNYHAAETAYSGLTHAVGENDENVASRRARMALLQGANDDAKAAFSHALTIELGRATPSRELVAWYSWQLGDTDFFTGDYREARSYYDDALQVYPGYFRALASRGRLDAAESRFESAVSDYQAAIDELPDPTFVAELGDVYAAHGDGVSAQREYDLVDFIGHLSVVNGVMYNRQLVMFDADHGRKADEALRLAEREYRTRRDILGADAVAWTALKAGKLDDADVAMHSALRMGTMDPRLLYHAGMIAARRGQSAKARTYLQRALSLSPNFDVLQSTIARHELQRLQYVTDRG